LSGTAGYPSRRSSGGRPAVEVQLEHEGVIAAARLGLEGADRGEVPGARGARGTRHVEVGAGDGDLTHRIQERGNGHPLSHGIEEGQELLRSAAAATAPDGILQGVVAGTSETGDRCPAFPIHLDVQAPIVQEPAEVGGETENAVGAHLGEEQIAALVVPGEAAGGGEVVRIGEAGHIGVAGRVQRQRLDVVVEAAGQEGRVDQRAAVGGDPGQETVFPRGGRRVGFVQEREVPGIGEAGHVSMAGRVHRDRVRLVGIFPLQEDRVLPGAGMIQLEDEGVRPAGPGRRHGGGKRVRERKVLRVRRPGDVGIALPVDDDAGAGLPVRAADIGREQQPAGRSQPGHEGIHRAAEAPLESGADREVRRPGGAGDIETAGPVDGDADGIVVRRAAQIGRDEELPVRAQLGQEDVHPAAGALLEGLAADGEIQRPGGAGDIEVAGGIEGDADRKLVRRSAQADGPEEVAGEVEPRDEHVKAGRSIARGGSREIRGVRVPRHPGIAGGIHGDGAPDVGSAATQVGRVAHDRRRQGGGHPGHAEEDRRRHHESEPGGLPDETWQNVLLRSA
jgi:hypothetical protein